MTPAQVTAMLAPPAKDSNAPSSQGPEQGTIGDLERLSRMTRV